MKERKFKKGLQRRIELITNILNIKGGHYDYKDMAAGMAAEGVDESERTE